MLRTLAAVCLSTLVSLSLTPLICRLALRRGLVDPTDGWRKVHRVPVPRLGGIAIVVAFLLAFAVTVPAQLPTAEGHLTALLLGSLVIAALGIYDDLRGARAPLKLAVQIAVAAGLFAAGLRIGIVSTPFGPVAIGFWSLPVTVLWIVGVTNAVNLIDGLDGLAAGVAIIALASVFAFSWQRGEILMMLVSASLGGAVLGFLVYNFNPARIFMGDTGSMFLGFLLASSALMAGQKSSTTVSLVAPAMVLGLPIGDTLWAIVRRAARRRPLFSADRDHVHHRLLRAGFSQREAVLILYAVCLLLGVAAQGFWRASGLESMALLGVVALLALGGLAWLRPFGSQRGSPDESLDPFVGISSSLARTLAGISTEGELWSAVRDAAAATGALSASLVLGEGAAAVTYATTLAGGAGTISLVHPIPTLRIALEWRQPTLTPRPWSDVVLQSLREAVDRIDSRRVAALAVEVDPVVVSSR